MAVRSVESIMTPDVVEVSPDCPLPVVLERMHEGRISCVVVCEAGIAKGLITERDLPALARDLLTRPMAELCARDIMSTTLHALDVTTTVPDATTIARKHSIRHLPVLEPTGELAGLVTQSDLFRAYADQMQELVAERTQQLESANRALELMSKQDALLEIGNRRAMDEMLTHLHEVARRYDRPYAIVLCDVDHFKQYNDTNGHLAGDDALRSVAKQIERAARSVDLVFRYGGEEILVALPETEREGARPAAERIRSGVEQLALPHAGSPFGVVTVSCGIAGSGGLDVCESEWDAVVTQADHALYRAKAAGRNCVS